MNRKIKESYNKIVIPEYVEKSILNKTVESKRKNYRLAFTIGIIVSLLVFVGSVNADAIDSLLARIFDRGAVVDKEGNRYQMYEEVNGVSFKNLSSWLADKEFDTTINKVEDKLGVKILKYDDVTTNELKCEFITNKVWDSENKGRVERVYLRWFDFYRPDEYGHDYGFSMSVKMISDKAEESTIMSYLEEMNVAAGKNVIEEYHSNNLDTDVIIYDFPCDYEGCKDRENDEIYAMFVYKNIRYEFYGTFKKGDTQINKLKEIIEDLYE